MYLLCEKKYIVRFQTKNNLGSYFQRKIFMLPF